MDPVVAADLHPSFSGVFDFSETVSAGNAEKGPSVVDRLNGGRPRRFFLMPPIPVLLHAEETTFAPWRRCRDFGFDGVMADRGSSFQNGFLVDGVIADWG